VNDSFTDPNTGEKNRRLGRKKNDWILYAYIIEHAGGTTSIGEIQSKLVAWQRRNANSRRIAQILGRNKSKGFVKLADDHQKNRRYGYSSVWSFEGTLPKIDRRTKQHWDSKLSPKGDKPEN